MAKKKPGKRPAPRGRATKKKPAAKVAGRKSVGRRPPRSDADAEGGPLTVEDARRLVAQGRAAAAAPPGRRKAAGKARAPEADPEVLAERAGEERQAARERRDEVRAQRTRDYEETVALLTRRGVRARGAKALAPRAGARLPRIFAEGDSWFDYPALAFGGGIIGRLERRLAVPILNLACRGDEVRMMLGVEQRKVLQKHLGEGTRGQAWDALLFSGGGNDIVGDPMALWVRDHDASKKPEELIHWPRFEAQLAVVRAGYEDLIGLRDTLSPDTLLVFHGYDFAIPDGRGICGFGPWLKPTFDLRGFQRRGRATKVVRAMLERFAGVLHELAAAHAGVVVLPTQGTLAPKTASWHNELHPSKSGFNTFADLFADELRGLLAQPSA